MDYYKVFNYCVRLDAKSDIVEWCYSLIFLLFVRLLAVGRLDSRENCAGAGRCRCAPPLTVPFQLILGKFFFAEQKKNLLRISIRVNFLKRFLKKIFFKNSILFELGWTVYFLENPGLNRMLSNEIIGFNQAFLKGIKV